VRRRRKKVIPLGVDEENRTVRKKALGENSGEEGCVVERKKGAGEGMKMLVNRKRISVPASLRGNGGAGEKKKVGQRGKEGVSRGVRSHFRKEKEEDPRGGGKTTPPSTRRLLRPGPWEREGLKKGLQGGTR